MPSNQNEAPVQVFQSQDFFYNSFTEYVDIAKTNVQIPTKWMLYLQDLFDCSTFIAKACTILECKRLELVSKELNHLAAILHVYAGGLNFMQYKKKIC